MSDLPADGVLPPPAASAAPADGESKAKEEAAAERPYDFLESERWRHRQVLWAVPSTLLVAAAGAYCGYARLPAALQPHPSVVTNLETGGMWLLGLLTIGGIFMCYAFAWPTPVFGPKPLPPMWILLLQLAASWLLIFPFAPISLILAALGSWAAVDGAWGLAGIWLAGALLFAVAATLLLIDNAAMRNANIKPGGEVPASARRSKWWRQVQALLIFWALLMTAFAVMDGVKHEWGDFTGSVGTAILAWLACLTAATGEMPEEVFEA